MHLPMNIPVLDRRAFVLGATAAAALAPLLASPSAAQEVRRTWEDALKEIAGDAKPATDKRFVFDLPDVAENGNMVPFTIGVESPMTERDHVRAIYVISTGNPLPNVATFRFTPLSGRAWASSRMRLAQTQDVIGVAELSDGKLLMVRRPVKVQIGGCGG
jgi:sulfur-oxidizing protein SoxY